MRFVYLIFFIALQATSFALNEIEPDWSLYHENEIQLLFKNMTIEQKNEYMDDLRKAKLSLINGDIRYAIDKLEYQIAKNKNEKLNIVSKRYLAFAYFSIGDFTQTLNILSDKRFQTQSNFKKVCLLKIAASLHLPFNNQMKLDIKNCKNINYSLQNSGYLWLDYIEQLKEGVVKDQFFYKALVTKLGTYEDEDPLRAWLKYGLYFKEEDLVVKFLDILPEKAFQNETLRTLIAYNQYRNLNYKDASNFIEDITNSSALFLKALLMSKDNNLKTSYANLLATNKRRPYSINANQLLVAISWLTQNYETGRLALSKLIPTSLHEREKKLLTTAFLINENKFARADKEVEEIQFLYNGKLPFEGLLLESYTYFRNENKKWDASSFEACLKLDGVSCWLNQQSIVWENYEKSFKEFSPKDFSVTEYLNDITSQKSFNKFKEANFIKARDIIDLDIEIDPYLEDMAVNEP